ncbi:nucleotidyltransferase domain-containing protein [Palaeococcus sp. (in: euryarchaeotes)]
MSLSKLVSTENRVKILEYVMERDTVSVEQTSRALHLSKGLISLYFSTLVDEGIIVKKEKIFKVRHEDPLMKSLKILLNTYRLKNLLSKFREPWMKSLGVYGSYAKGENRRESDIDIWILTDQMPSIEKTAYLQGRLRGEIGRDIDLLILTPDKLKRIRQNDPIFYYSIVFGSILIWGEDIAGV